MVAAEISESRLFPGVFSASKTATKALVLIDFWVELTYFHELFYRALKSTG